MRFVSECMTDPAQLRASMMQELRCLQGGDICRHHIRSHGVNSIPFRRSELCRLGMDKEDTIWQYCGEMPAADQMRLQIRIITTVHLEIL